MTRLSDRAGLAGRKAQRLVLARNLLSTLRDRELETVAKTSSAETGLTHHPVTEGQRVAGVYCRSVQLASVRFALLENGAGFHLIPG